MYIKRPNRIPTSTRMGIGDGLGQTDHRKEESQSPAVLVAE
jgi:hypothetical protein